MQDNQQLYCANGMQGLDALHGRAQALTSFMIFASFSRALSLACTNLQVTHLVAC